jgi:hypothetical protein
MRQITKASRGEPEKVTNGYSFIVSTNGVDRDGDRISQHDLYWDEFDAAGAPCMMAHETKAVPIGKWLPTSRRIIQTTDADGNTVEATVMTLVCNPHTPAGQEAAGSIEEDFLNGCSVSFLPSEAGRSNQYGGDDYVDQRLRVVEVSLTATPANPSAIKQAAMTCKGGVCHCKDMAHDEPAHDGPRPDFYQHVKDAAEHLEEMDDDMSRHHAGMLRKYGGTHARSLSDAAHHLHALSLDEDLAEYHRNASAHYGTKLSEMLGRHHPHEALRYSINFLKECSEAEDFPGRDEARRHAERLHALRYDLVSEHNNDEDYYTTGGERDHEWRHRNALAHEHGSDEEIETEHKEEEGHAPHPNNPYDTTLRERYGPEAQSRQLEIHLWEKMLAEDALDDDERREVEELLRELRGERSSKGVSDAAVLKALQKMAVEVSIMDQQLYRAFGQQYRRK